MHWRTWRSMYHIKPLVSSSRKNQQQPVPVSRITQYAHSRRGHTQMYLRAYLQSICMQVRMLRAAAASVIFTIIIKCMFVAVACTPHAAAPPGGRGL